MFPVGFTYIEVLRQNADNALNFRMVSSCSRSFRVDYYYGTVWQGDSLIQDYLAVSNMSSVRHLGSFPMIRNLS